MDDRAKHDGIEASIEQIAEPLCRAHGVELVEVRVLRQGGASIVRVTIDREGSVHNGVPGSGVTLTDCQSVSRDLSTALDVADAVLPGRYHLEVSSPGLERPLVKLPDFARFAGNDAKIRTKDVVDGRRNFRGVLKGVDGDRIRIQVDGTVFDVPFASVARAQLLYPG